MTQKTSILDLIGNTPLIRLTHFDTGCCQLYIKLECNNPNGSIKDRTALSIINTAESKGELKPGQEIIEATAGNTGISLSAICRAKGYQMNTVIPDKMSQEKIDLLKMMGANVILTRSDVSRGHPDYYLDLAERLSQQKGYFYTNQFANKANIEAHFKTTGPEIWQQTAGKVDAFVCGVGTGGTLTGAGRYLKAQKPRVELILADPEGSLLADKVNNAPEKTPGSWLVEGIGEDFVPDNCDLSLADQAFTISDQDAFSHTRALFNRELILAGTSTGVLLAAALRYCQQQTTPKTVVTLACDTGNRYLSKAFNHQWLEQHHLTGELESL
ncbi:PLP-dependent cysteine synthase family protein [Endozoicomonas elysicola]|uniref:Cysteine synthase B n=1 Tax=Endozoicomonas elysicola TaxID=305900 RepID=A0A081K6N3_9GAMM|nr:PLP-dependent cysteine synthase family protein [Endozoicomonas elysicola]KEI69809.1 cystathionine beta-lyase [Endozoicomonas elysicola]